MKTISDVFDALTKQEEKYNKIYKEGTSGPERAGAKAMLKKIAEAKDELFAEQESQKKQGTHVMPDGSVMNNEDMQMMAGGGTIYIKPENRGKFNATKQRTGKTTEELTHSKNPLTKKRAIFAQNAAKWNKYPDGGTHTNPPYAEDNMLRIDDPNDVQPIQSIPAPYISTYYPSYGPGIVNPKAVDDLIYENRGLTWGVPKLQPRNLPEEKIIPKRNYSLPNDVVIKDPSIPIRDEGEFKVSGSEMPESGGYRTSILPSAISAAAGTLPLLYQASLPKRNISPEYAKYIPIDLPGVDYGAARNEILRQGELQRKVGRQVASGTRSLTDASAINAYSNALATEQILPKYSQIAEAEANANAAITGREREYNVGEQRLLDKARIAENKYVNEMNETERARKQENIMALLSGSANNANQFLQDYQGARMQDYAINNLLIAGDYKWNAKTSKWEYLPGASKTTNYSGANTTKSTNANTNGIYTDIPTPYNPDYIEPGPYAPYNPLLTPTETSTTGSKKVVNGNKTGSSGSVNKKLTSEELKQSQSKNPFIYPQSNYGSSLLQGVPSGGKQINYDPTLIKQSSDNNRNAIINIIEKGKLRFGVKGALENSLGADSVKASKDYKGYFEVTYNGKKYLLDKNGNII